MLSDFQAMLLAFFGQELVAHAASMFAALGGAFLFMSSLRPKPIKIKRVVGFCVISALLISIVIYAGFRMVVYGQLSAFVMGSAPPPSQPDNSTWTLVTYYSYIENLSRSSVNQRPCWNKWFFQLSGAFYYPTNEAGAAYTIGGVWLLSFILVYFSTVGLSRLSYFVKRTPGYVAERVRRILGKGKAA